MHYPSKIKFANEQYSTLTPVIKIGVMKTMGGGGKKGKEGRQRKSVIKLTVVASLFRSLAAELTYDGTSSLSRQNTAERER